MRWYRGPQASDEKPVGGGSYTKEALGHEAFNFLASNGEMFGYFQPRLQPPALRKKHPSTIALERIEAGFTGEELKGIVAVFVATDPKRGGQRIIGWFRDATVYRHEQPSSANERNLFSYFLRARAENAVLVPEARRSFMIPAGRGAFGQANVCYALDSSGQRKSEARWMGEALKYIESYALENVAQEPESETDHDVEQMLGSTIEHAAGFQSNPRIRRAIEDYAMRWAKERLFALLGQKPVDKHKTESYDFLCNDVYVEVKGTQDNGNSVSLTPKEADHAREHKNSALLIVHSVQVKGKRRPVVSGGKETFLHPWDISTGTLKPRGYVFTLGKAQGE
jgi:hypothetical protein